MIGTLRTDIGDQILLQTPTILGQEISPGNGTLLQAMLRIQRRYERAVMASVFPVAADLSMCSPASELFQLIVHLTRGYLRRFGNRRIKLPQRLFQRTHQRCETRLGGFELLLQVTRQNTASKLNLQL